MNAKLTKVTGVGVLDNERVVIKALNDIDIGRYGVFKTGVNISEGKKIINTKIYFAYWFPDKFIKANDLVVLYTKAGISSEKNNTDGTTTHFFYCGLSTPMWAGENGTVLASIPEWEVLI